VFFLTLLVLFIPGYLRKLPVIVVLIPDAIFFRLLAGTGLDATLLRWVSGMGSMFTGFAICDPLKASLLSSCFPTRASLMSGQGKSTRK